MEPEKACSGGCARSGAARGKAGALEDGERYSDGDERAAPLDGDMVNGVQADAGADDGNSKLGALTGGKAAAGGRHR
jgi:hypothetical protein